MNKMTKNNMKKIQMKIKHKMNKMKIELKILKKKFINRKSKQFLIRIQTYQRKHQKNSKKKEKQLLHFGMENFKQHHLIEAKHL